MSPSRNVSAPLTLVAHTGAPIVNVAAAAVLIRSSWAIVRDARADLRDA